MDSAMPQEKLEEVFDRITRKVTRDSVGIQLVQGGTPPENNLCTVHITFRRGFSSSLSFRADAAIFVRMTQSIIKGRRITPQDVEDVAKEYFNVLCGHIAADMFKATRISSRFGVPSFHQGSYAPQNQKEQFVLNYSNAHNESAQLVHHISALPGTQDGTQQNGTN